MVLAGLCSGIKIGVATTDENWERNHTTRPPKHVALGLLEIRRDVQYDHRPLASSNMEHNHVQESV